MTKPSRFRLASPGDCELFAARPAGDTTPFRPDLGSLHPYVEIVVRWNRERCPKCERELPYGTRATFDVDARAVFCFLCAKQHIVWLERAEPVEPHRTTPRHKSRCGSVALSERERARATETHVDPLDRPEPDLVEPDDPWDIF